MVGIGIGTGCSSCCTTCTTTQGLPNSIAPPSENSQKLRYFDTFEGTILNPIWRERYGASDRVLPDSLSYASLPQNDGDAPKIFDVLRGKCVCSLDPTVGPYALTPNPGGLYLFSPIIPNTGRRYYVNGRMARKRLNLGPIDRATTTQPTLLVTFNFSDFKLPKSGPWFGHLKDDWYVTSASYNDRFAPYFSSGWVNKTRYSQQGTFYDPAWEWYTWNTLRHVGVKINYGHKNSDPELERSYSYFSCLPYAYFIEPVTDPVSGKGVVTRAWRMKDPQVWNFYQPAFDLSSFTVHYRSPNTNWHACRDTFIQPQQLPDNTVNQRFTLKEDEGLRTEQVNGKRITYALAKLTQNFWPTNSYMASEVALFRYYFVGDPGNYSHTLVVSERVPRDDSYSPPKEKDMFCWPTIAHEYGYGFFPRWGYDTDPYKNTRTGVPEGYSISYDNFLAVLGSITDREMISRLPNIPPVLYMPSVGVTGNVITNLNKGQTYIQGQIGAQFGLFKDGRITAYDWDGYITKCVIDNLPPGLQLDFTAGQLYGTPTTAGTYPLTITVTDNRGGTDSNSGVWTIVVNP